MNEYDRNSRVVVLYLSPRAGDNLMPSRAIVIFTEQGTPLAVDNVRSERMGLQFMEQLCSRILSIGTYNGILVRNIIPDFIQCFCIVNNTCFLLLHSLLSASKPNPTQILLFHAFMT
uniref:Uncharacterized protein n=1 Tax=Oryza rufipogon TaxID=4529 RepID=A0A0E0NXC9_ORYRU